MKHIHYKDEPPETITASGASGVSLRTVIGEKDGADNFFMRIVTMSPGGKSPNHSHDYEHEMYIISGSGVIEINGEHREVKQGDVIYIPPNIPHCFKTEKDLELICCIPKS